MSRDRPIETRFWFRIWIPKCIYEKWTSVQKLIANGSFSPWFPLMSSHVVYCVTFVLSKTLLYILQSSSKHWDIDLRLRLCTRSPKLLTKRINRKEWLVRSLMFSLPDTTVTCGLTIVLIISLQNFSNCSVRSPWPKWVRWMSVTYFM